MTRLDALLAHVLVDFNDHVDSIRRPQRGAPSLVQWANFLRVMPDDECVAPNDIALAARVSRREVKSRGARGLPHAWTEAGSFAPRKPWWRLSDAGRAARAQGREIVTAADEAWRAKIGSDPTASLRAAAKPFVAGLELELSHYPMAYGPADGRAVGGRSVPAQPGPPAFRRTAPTGSRSFGPTATP